MYVSEFLFEWLLEGYKEEIGGKEGGTHSHVLLTSSLPHSLMRWGVSEPGE